METMYRGEKMLLVGARRRVLTNRGAGRIVNIKQCGHKKLARQRLEGRRRYFVVHRLRLTAERRGSGHRPPGAAWPRAGRTSRRANGCCILFPWRLAGDMSGGRGGIFRCGLCEAAGYGRVPAGRGVVTARDCPA